MMRGVVEDEIGKKKVIVFLEVFWYVVAHACNILTTIPNVWRGTTQDYTHMLPSNFILLLTSSPASSFLIIYTYKLRSIKTFTQNRKNKIGG